MKKLKHASSPKKPVANVVVIKDPATKFGESVLYITQKILSTHWANFSDVEVVQLMTLRRAISTALLERMGGA